MVQTLKIVTFLFLLVAPELQAAETASTDTVEEINESPLGAALEIQYGYKNYSLYNISTSTKNPSSSNAFHITLETLYPTSAGKAGIGLGAGFTSAREVKENPTAPGSASLFTYPVDFFVSYRADFVKNQFFVPFFKAGISYTWVRQVSTTGLTQPEAGNFALDYSIGLALCLNALDNKHAVELDRTVGINNTYVIIEYLTSKKLGPLTNPNISHNAYRVGLRFEY